MATQLQKQFAIRKRKLELIDERRLMLKNIYIRKFQIIAKINEVSQVAHYLTQT